MSRLWRILEKEMGMENKVTLLQANLNRQKVMRSVEWGELRHLMTDTSESQAKGSLKPQQMPDNRSERSTIYTAIYNKPLFGDLEGDFAVERWRGTQVLH